MEAEEPAAELSRKELRKQKLMEYLAAKGKQRPPEAKTHLQQRPPRQKAGSLHPPKVVVGKENQVPVDGIRPAASETWTTQTPPRRTVGVPGRVDIKGSALTNRQPAGHAAAPLNRQNPVLTRTYTVVSSKVGAAAGGLVKTQTNGKKPSNPARSSFKSSLSVAAALPCPSLRMSMGPCVKTRTGLIPAVLQPKSTNPHPTFASAKAQKMALRAAAVPACSVSHKSAATFPPTVKNGIKSNVKAVLLKGTPSTCKSSSSSRLTGTSSTNKPELVRPKGIPTTRKPQNPPTKSRPLAKEEKTNQPAKGAPQTSSKTSRCPSRTEGARRTATRTETSKDKKPTKTTTQAGSKHAGASGISQTAPQPSRNINFTGRADAKTPKVKVTVRTGPQTEGKKPSSAQEERLQKLQEWREAKGISYKRPPMQVRVPARRPPPTPALFWPSMRAEDEAHSLIFTVDRSLADCIKLLAEGCPADQVKGVLSRLPPVSQKFAKYWICRARLMEQEGNLDVLPLFQEAVRLVLEPVDELRTVVFDILKRKDELQVPEEDDDKEEAESGPTAGEPAENHHNPMMTPKPVRALINEEQGGSSVVKYKITATPGGPPSQRRESVKVNGQEVRFFTPVRRSVRIERASLQHPAALHDHDLCVSSYRHLMSEEGGAEGPSPPTTPVYIYRENEALKDKVFIQLICEEDPEPHV